MPYKFYASVIHDGQGKCEIFFVDFPNTPPITTEVKDIAFDSENLLSKIIHEQVDKCLEIPQSLPLISIYRKTKEYIRSKGQDPDRVYWTTYETILS